MSLKCDKEAMTMLVEALESGKYQQAPNTLRTRDDRYCCLGVACDISLAGRWMREGEDRTWNYVTAEGYNSGVMPKPVWEWLGLSVDGNYDVAALPLPGQPNEYNESFGSFGTSLNDGGASFKEIAAAIRKDYLDEPAA